MNKQTILRRRIGGTASWTALGLALACGGQAMAQTSSTTSTVAPAGDQNEAPRPDATDTLPPQDGDTIIVVGTRASQQSAINRKRQATTAVDSLVADDIGSFPDRNVNEAISRIPGVALSRNEFGEGDGFAVRGNGAGQTRIELDGIGVQATGNGTGTGRGADMRELPAELIKSVDVVKGSTADRTEGSIGGGVQIQTRSGLDFKKPYFSVRAGAQQSSLSNQWTPDFSAVASRKFFDDRVGVILTGTYAKLQNNAHNFENTTSGGNQWARAIDFDNSPEKTFSFNPATVGTDAADVAFGNSRAPDGTTLTPRELVTLSAGATSKAQCLALFPDIPYGFAAGQSNDTINSQVSQRVNEQNTCLAQWNDATPSLIRNFMNEQTEDRYSVDGRVDFRVTDNLVVFAKGTIANRKVHDQFRTRNQANGLFAVNPGGSFTVATPPNPNNFSFANPAPAGTFPLARSVAAGPNGAGYYLFDPVFARGVTTINVNTPTLNRNYFTAGTVTNVVPGSVKLDANHNVLEAELTNLTTTIDQIENTIDAKTKYGQIGAEYRGERLQVDAMAGLTRTEVTRADMRTSRSYNYGNAKISLQPNGLVAIQPTAPNYDENNMANYVQLRDPLCLNGIGTYPTCTFSNAGGASATSPATPARTAGQIPLLTNGIGVSYDPTLQKREERIAKLDLTYDTKDLLPIITRVKVGGMYRQNTIDFWGAGGRTVKSGVGNIGAANYVAPVVLPTNSIRGTLRACQETATSTVAAGGVGCQFGFVQNPDLANVRRGTDTLTPAQLIDLFERTRDKPDANYMNGLPNRGALPGAWDGIRTDLLFSELGASQYMNPDCIVRCVASDGQVYEQPVQNTVETIKNVYGMFDFEQRLPLGLLFNGNVGVRGVFRSVEGIGNQTLTIIRTTPSYNPADRNNAAGIATTTFTSNTTLNASTNDWLPSVNLNLWGFNEKVVLRAYGGKTMAAPDANNLRPGGTCIIDQRIELDTGEDVFGCTGRVGNPGLSPFSAWNYNVSLEWYPNADTQFSVAYGKLNVKIGNPRAVTVLARPFADSPDIDPVTNRPLADFSFNVPTFENGPGYSRNIYEVTGRTAFTFLPWFLRHTGADANVSILKSSVTTGVQDPQTGVVLPPPGESKYYVNASLWYDDGKLNIRTSYQWRTARFDCITPCGGGGTSDRNYPGEGYPNIALPYAPGAPRYIDATTYVDAKISYNVTPNFQVYVEGRNLLKEAQTISAGDYMLFADGSPRVGRLQYGGRRILGGASLRFGN